MSIFVLLSMSSFFVKGQTNIRNNLIRCRNFFKSYSFAEIFSPLREYFLRHNCFQEFFFRQVSLVGFFFVKSHLSPPTPPPPKLFLIVGCSREGGGGGVGVLIGSPFTGNGERGNDHIQLAALDSKGIP